MHIDVLVKGSGRCVYILIAPISTTERARAAERMRCVRNDDGRPMCRLKVEEANPSLTTFGAREHLSSSSRPMLSESLTSICQLHCRIATQWRPPSISPRSRPTPASSSTPPSPPARRTSSPRPLAWKPSSKRTRSLSKPSTLLPTRRRGDYGSGEQRSGSYPDWSRRDM